MGQYYFAGVFPLSLGRLLMRRRAQALIKILLSVFRGHSGHACFYRAFSVGFYCKKNNKNIVEINLITNKIKIHKRLRLISEK